MSVYIIAHKPFTADIEREGYRTLQVGACRGHDFGDVFDDEGDHISDKNANYCELTGIYWLWKNCDDPWIGIVHYRRYFTRTFIGKKALSNADIEKLLKKFDVILPFHATYHKNWTVYDDLCNGSVKKSDVSKVADIIKKKYPAYYDDFWTFLDGYDCHLYNMAIMRKAHYDAYCAWLFDILFELEKNIDLEEDYTAYQKRIYGFFSERMLNVWVIHNRLRYCEVGVIPTDEAWDVKKRLATGCKRVLRYMLL